MTSCVVYLRISEDRAGDELGVTRQREDCLKLAEARGYSVTEVVTDNDVSALSKNKRPGFERVMSLLADGAVQTVVAWNFERVLKTRSDQLRFIELGQERGVMLALARGADLDMSTSGGRLMADLLASIARNETELKSERQVRAYRQQAEQGKPHFVARPYGYTRQGELVEEEAAVLRQMAEHFLTGWSTGEITRWLNDQNIPAASGGAWSRRVVKDHLLSKRNAGIRVYKGEQYQGTWTPVFTPELHERLTSEWKRRHGGASARSDNRKYLLTGLLDCGICGRPMMGGAHYDRKGQESRAKYRCVASGQGCTGLMRVAVTLDHLVTEAVLYRLDSPEMKALLVQGESKSAEIEPLRAREGALSDRLDSLLIDYTDGTLTKPEYVTAKARVSEMLRGVESDLAALYSSEHALAALSPSVSLREAWEQNSVGWRRKLLGLLIERVTVNRSHGRQAYYIDGKRYRFDPEAVDIQWLH